MENQSKFFKLLIFISIFLFQSAESRKLATALNEDKNAKLTYAAAVKQIKEQQQEQKSDLSKKPEEEQKQKEKEQEKKRSLKQKLVTFMKEHPGKIALLVGTLIAAASYFQSKSKGRGGSPISRTSTAGSTPTTPNPLPSPSIIEPQTDAPTSQSIRNLGEMLTQIVPGASISPEEKEKKNIRHVAEWLANNPDQETKIRSRFVNAKQRYPDDIIEVPVANTTINEANFEEAVVEAGQLRRK